MGQILALDLATKTGVARGTPGDPPASIVCTTWTMPSGGADDVGAFMNTFMHNMKNEIETGDPIDIIIFEAPYISRQARPNVIRRTYGMPAVIEAFAYSRKIECAEVSVATLKKSFAGSGKAEKEDMIVAAMRRGFKVMDDHQADAAAAWLYAVGIRHKNFLSLYDPDFRAFMGGK